MITQELLHWIKETNRSDKNILIAKGLYKIPRKVSDWILFISFVKKLGRYYK